MAKIVDSSRLWSSPISERPQNRYPWDEWLDGQCREFVMGEDFNHVSCGSFLDAARMAAKTRGMKTETKIDSLTVCVMRAYSPGE